MHQQQLSKYHLWITLAFLLVSSTLLQTVTAQSLQPGESVPSGVAESDASASGSNCPNPITRGSLRFTDLYENYNSDIVFKDEEGTGADHHMTWRCANTLDFLAILVSSEWPGIKLRVTEAWDEDMEHTSPRSLHYCGRAVDLTTSDRDQSKYGRLGQLAVDAGFTYVEYETGQPHIHASVRQCDSSDFACDNGDCIPYSWECDNEDDCGDNSDEDHCSGTNDCASDQFRCNDGTCIPASWECDGMDDCTDGEDESSTCNNDGGGGGSDSEGGGIPGCFPPHAKVLTPDKNVTMEDLKINTPVLVLNEKGKLTYSPVIAFLDNTDDAELKYITIETEDETEITLTRSHLIHKANHGNSSQLQKPTDAQPIFASKVKVNDYIYTRSSQCNEVQPSKVVKVTNAKKNGAYAPLTLEGTIIVDNTLASCYAVIDDHRLAHTTLAPLRLLYHSMPRLLREREGEMLLSWYPRLLETVGRMVLDETHFHHSTVKHLVRED